MSPGTWRWLLLLPVAVALVAVASASRLQLFWWPDELHEETSGRLGEVVRVADLWVGPDNEDRVRELDLTVVEVVPASTVKGFSEREPVMATSGTAVWEIVLRIEADPEVPLGSCRVSLLDGEGRETEATGGTTHGDVTLPLTSCTPIGAPGPMLDGSQLSDTEPRPPSYQVKVYAVTSDGFEPTAVRVWWEAPDYVEVDLTE